MRLVYVCSPLRGNIEANQRKADEYCAYAAACGVVPLAPHTIFTRYLDENIPEQREQGLKLGTELLKHCNELWVMGGVISEGMQSEIKLARELHLPVLYIDDEMVQSGYKIRQEDKPLDKNYIIPNSEKADYENQIVVVDPKALYLWVSDKPIKNETVEAFIKDVESDLTADHSTDLEVEP